MECFGPNETTLFFLIDNKFYKEARNKHVDLRKIENFARSKCYIEDISKTFRRYTRNYCYDKW